MVATDEGGLRGSLDVTVTVTDVDDTGSTDTDLLGRYDDNKNGKIDRDEVLDGIEDFFDPDVEISRDEVLDLIELFFEGLLGS